MPPPSRRCCRASAQSRRGCCRLPLRPRPRPGRPSRPSRRRAARRPSAAAPPTAAVRRTSRLLTIVGRLGPVQLDGGGAGVERRHVAHRAERRPRRRRRHAGKHRHRPPDKIDPRAGRLVPFDHDAHGNADECCRVQLTVSKWRTGSPVTRFCGFRRRTLSAAIAAIRYTGSPLTFSTISMGSAKVSR